MVALSDAILLGAMLRPQVTGKIFRDDGSCVMGAALEGAGLASYSDGEQDGEAYFLKMHYVWPALTEHTLCPECGAGHTRKHFLWHLNDVHQWTRERIAAWVRIWETPEPEQGGVGMEVPREARVGAR